MLWKKTGKKQVTLSWLLMVFKEAVSQWTSLLAVMQPGLTIYYLCDFWIV